MIVKLFRLKKKVKCKNEKQLAIAETYFCDPTNSLIQTLKKNINENLILVEKQPVIELL